jgi:hypothetical protein
MRENQELDQGFDSDCGLVGYSHGFSLERIVVVEWSNL